MEKVLIIAMGIAYLLFLSILFCWAIKKFIEAVTELRTTIRKMKPNKIEKTPADKLIKEDIVKENGGRKR